MGRVYDDDAIRDIVMSMEHPTIATRGVLVVAVNDAYVRDRGVVRSELEGKSIVPFIAPEEKERLTQRMQTSDDAVTFDQPLRTISKSAEGHIRPILTFTSRFRAAEPPDYRVTHVYAQVPQGGELTFARELLGISAELISARTEDEVRARTRAAFERAGFVARFVSAGVAPGPDGRAAEAAVREKRPVFTGGSSPDPEGVYVPFDADEVLYVGGKGLSGQHAYAFGFFAKLVSTALLDLRASEAARRKLSDTQLLLQLARTTSETLDLDAVLGATADSLVKLLDVSSCFILLYDEPADALRGRASSSTRRGVVSDIDVRLDDRSIAAAAARARAPIVIPDARTDPRALLAPLAGVSEAIALAALPIVSRGRLEGVVVLDDTRGARSFDPEWIELAAAMVVQVGLSIANARLYESLRTSYEELAATRAEMVKRERLAGLGELAAIVAHEVRNPVGVIYNASSSLKRLVEESSDGGTLVGIVREECERLNQMVGALLDFARPHQLSLSREEIPRLLGDVLDALGDPVRVRVEIHAPDSLPLLEVDRRLMRQALLNVAQNAVQSMPHGGVLRLRASAAEGERGVTIEIADEGEGISASDLPRIFEPFFTTKPTGSGLGLALVKRIVEDHGGEVSVTSSADGTTFLFRLPRARETRNAPG
jgi:signal transduction histidine kinase